MRFGLAKTQNCAIFYTIMEKNNEKQYTVIDDSYILCPKCSEKLFPADIESFRRCPYCDCALPQSQELEDFVLSPLIRQWSKNTYNQFSR